MAKFKAHQVGWKFFDEQNMPLPMTSFREWDYPEASEGKLEKIARECFAEEYPAYELVTKE